nr:MAG TPA: hypothetical protein [Caudoviricetes sp.]
MICFTSFCANIAKNEPPISFTPVVGSFFVSVGFISR